MATKSYWQRLQRERISRRRLLGAAGVGAAGLAVAAACGGGDGDGDGPTPTGETTPGATATTGLGAPVRGGRFKEFIDGDWGTIDPVTSVSFGPENFARMYNPLIDRSRMQPEFFFFDLAESVEQPDDETYIYTIRTGVKIAPNELGIPERDMDELDAQRWLERLSEDPEAVNRVFVNDWLQSFEAPGTGLFEIKTNGPYAYFLFRLGANLGGAIPPREFFEQDISLKDQGVGAGAFVLRPGTFEETGGAKLDRNINYYRTDERTGEQLPYIDGVDVSRVSDRTARRVAFVNRELHTYDPETIAEVDDLRSQFPDFSVAENPSNTPISFTMNPTKPPWDDERIRKAALFALDRQEFVDIVGQGAGQPNGLVHWALEDFALPQDELEQLQPHDPEESRRLIRAATGEDTIRIKVMYPVTNLQRLDRHVPILLRQMKEAGFDIDPDPQEFTTWLGNYTTLNYDASISNNQVYEIPEIPLDFQSSGGPQGDQNFAIGVGAIVDGIDEAILDAKRTVDLEELKEKVRAVQRLIYEKGPTFLPIFGWISFDVYHGFVKNHPDLRGLGDTRRYLTDWWLEL